MLQSIIIEQLFLLQRKKLKFLQHCESYTKYVCGESWSEKYCHYLCLDT